MKTAEQVYTKWFDGLHIKGPRSLVKSNIIQAMEEYASQLPINQQLVEALEKIARWELPETNRFFDDDKNHPMSFRSCYGSKGERNYMISIAEKALTSAKSQQPESKITHADRLKMIEDIPNISELVNDFIEENELDEQPEPVQPVELKQKLHNRAKEIIDEEALELFSETYSGQVSECIITAMLRFANEVLSAATTQKTDNLKEGE